MILLEDFLKDYPTKLNVFPECHDWRNEEQSVKSFENSREALGFLKDNVNYGRDNYYITPENLWWMLIISHEEDLHIYGNKDIVGRFRNPKNL